MVAKISAHPSTAQLRAFGLGQLRPSESAVVEQHVETCDACCRVLNDVPDDGMLEKLKQYDTVTFDAIAEATPIESETARGNIPQALLEHSRYHILMMLGRGGMGVVYKAEHRLMERVVALKVISRRMVSNPLAVERFQREFKAAARLTHPNIVVAHDADQAGGLHFLVMEFVDGVSLAQYVERKGPLPVATASLFIRQVALGLHHAAQQGMVHRDIKPQNLMLTRKGQIKILDFGLARFASEESVSRTSVSGDNDLEFAMDSGLTEAGMIVGTPDYMAPEQAVDSSKADIRADIYSLGCTFFFLLTGQAPFSDNSVTRTLQSHADRQPPALHKLRGDLPPELIRLVERMMAKDPAKRVQTPGEVAKRLTEFSIGGLAAAGAFDVVVSKPIQTAPVRADSSSGAGHATTMQLVRSGRWRTIYHRARYAMRYHLRTRPHRIAATLLVLLLAGVTTMLLSATWNALTEGESSGPPVAVVKAAQQRLPRVALILSRRDFWRPDYLEVRETLERLGTTITVVSSRVGPVTSEAKYEANQEAQEVQAEVAFGDVRPGDFDAVVFVSSSHMEFLYDPEDVIAARQTTFRVLNELRESNVCLAAMGNAISVLAHYRVLDGHEAAGMEWLTTKTELATVKWNASQPVVSGGPDGQFVTAQNARSATPFAEQVHASAKKRARGDGGRNP